MRIYLYNENCTRSGQVAGVVDDAVAREIDELLENDRDDEAGVLAGLPLGDCHYCEGSEESLVEAEKAHLATRHDTRPGGASDAYRWRCCRNILAYFGVEAE